jgi:hypothetical protein
VYVLVRMRDASRTVYSIMVENTEGGDCLATAAFTTFGSQDKKGAPWVSLLNDPVTCLPTRSPNLPTFSFQYTFTEWEFHVSVLPTPLLFQV